MQRPRGGLKPALKGAGPSSTPSGLRRRVVLLAQPVAVVSPSRGDGQQWYNETDYLQFEEEADAAPPIVIRGVGIGAASSAPAAAVSALRHPPLLGSSFRDELEAEEPRPRRLVALPTAVPAPPTSPLPGHSWLDDAGDENVDPSTAREFARAVGSASKHTPRLSSAAPVRHSPMKTSPHRSPRRSPRLNGRGSQLRDLGHLTMDELKSQIRDVARRRRERQGRFRVTPAVAAGPDADSEPMDTR